MIVIKSQNDVGSVQLHLYNENKEAFVAAMDEDEYNHKINEYLNKFLDPSVANNPVESISHEVEAESSVSAVLDD
jgi:hypothetical protein